MKEEVTKKKKRRVPKCMVKVFTWGGVPKDPQDGEKVKEEVKGRRRRLRLEKDRWWGKN